MSVHRHDPALCGSGDWPGHVDLDDDDDIVTDPEHWNKVRARIALAHASLPVEVDMTDPEPCL